MKADLENIYLAAYEKENDKELDVDVCLLNLSERPQVVEVMQGSYEADIDGFMDLGHSNYKTITLPAKGFQKIDHFDDEGQLDFTTGTPSESMAANSWNTSTGGLCFGTGAWISRF